MQVRKLSAKLNIVYSVALVFSLALYSGILYFHLSTTLYDIANKELREKSTQITNMLDAYLKVLGKDDRAFLFSVQSLIAREGEHPHANKVFRLEQLWTQQERAMGLDNDYVNILSISGESVALSGPYGALRYPNLQKDINLAVQGRPTIRNFKSKDIHLRLITISIPLGLKDPYVLQVGTSVKEIENILYQRRILYLLSMLFTIAIATLINQIFVRRILRPIFMLASTARNISFRDLSKRITTKYPDEELQDLINAFNDMISRLEKSFAYISQFSSHVSHELKTPLAIIKGESELALRKVQSSDEYRRVLKSNLEELERMIKTVDDLLLLTRLDYRSNVLKTCEMDLIEFIKEMRESLKILADPKDIEIRYHFPAGMVEIKGDVTHLRRLFYNLVHNAVKFTANGGRIEITIKREGSWALVLIKDSGMGIPEDVLPKIFDQFFHYGGNGSSKVAGTGLGLTIAQSIAKLHNGRISAKSVVGKGTTFIVELPACSFFQSLLPNIGGRQTS